jgi:uncharacterized protein YbjT (DUF2867 family)
MGGKYIMILLTGITGTTGKKVVDIMCRRNIPVRAMVRDPAKIKGLDLPGVEIVQGDFSDEASLDNAMQGVEKVFLLTPNVEEQLEYEQRFIDVAKRNDISHVVKLSASSAEAGSPMVMRRYHGDAEVYLAHSGLTYTNIRPNYYMQNMMFSAASIIEEDKFYLPFAKGTTAIIDVDDVANFVVEMLTGTGHEGQTYVIAGPEVLSFYDLAEQMSSVLSREITYVDVPLADFKEELRNWDPSDWYVDAVMEQFALVNQGKSAIFTDTFAKVMGRAPGSFRQFVEKYAAAFKPG